MSIRPSIQSDCLTQPSGLEATCFPCAGDIETNPNYIPVQLNWDNPSDGCTDAYEIQMLDNADMSVVETKFVIMSGSNDSTIFSLSNNIDYTGPFSFRIRPLFLDGNTPYEPSLTGEWLSFSGEFSIVDGCCASETGIITNNRYACVVYDEYDPATGLFTLKQDCIEWNEDILGPYEGPTYATQQECYNNSLCVQTQNNNPSPNHPINGPNNWCDIHISNIYLINRADNIVTVGLEVPETYYDTYIEYSVDEGLTFLRINLNKENTIYTYNTFDIDLNTSSGSSSGSAGSGSGNSEICSLVFRLVRPCDIGSESGSGSDSGSESGDESGSGSGDESGSGLINNTDCVPIIVGTPRIQMSLVSRTFYYINASGDLVNYSNVGDLNSPNGEYIISNGEVLTMSIVQTEAGGSYSTSLFRIRNLGTENLTTFTSLIPEDLFPSGPLCDADASLAYSIETQSQITLEPCQTYDFTVTFNPAESGSYCMKVWTDTNDTGIYGISIPDGFFQFGLHGFGPLP